MAKQQINQVQVQGTTLGYAASSSTNQSGITTSTDLTGVSVLVTVPAGGRRVKITVTLQGYSSANGDVGATTIMEGATTLKIGRHYLTSSTSVQCTTVYSFTPSSGVHTYKAQFGRVTGSGTLLAENSVAPADILVELI